MMNLYETAMRHVRKTAFLENCHDHRFLLLAEAGTGQAGHDKLLQQAISELRLLLEVLIVRTVKLMDELADTGLAEVVDAATLNHLDIVVGIPRIFVDQRNERLEDAMWST